MGSLASLLDDLQSSDEARAEAAVAALAPRGDPAVEAVRPLLHAASAETRWWAVRTVAAIGGERSPRLLTVALGDEDPAVRQAAALGLRLHPSPIAASSLIERLGDDQPLTRQLASDALAALGKPAVPLLRQVLESGEPTARVQAARALALMKDPDAIGTLFALLDDPSALVAYWAERGLQTLGVGMVFFSP